MINGLKVHSSDFQGLTQDQVRELLVGLTPKQVETLKHDWKFWARENQIEPKGNWSIWLCIPGRGWGKTRTGVETVREWVKSGKKRIAAVAPTKRDVRLVMVEGESGFLNVCWKGDKTNRGVHLGYPEWSPTNNTLTWENGAKVEFFSAEDPERLRGPQFEAAWCDEIFAWTRMQKTWDMLRYTLRLGKSPKTLVTSTPKPVKLVRELIKRSELEPDKVILTTGSSYENDYIQHDEIRTGEGTRLGRQEIYGEILDEAAGALWTREMLELAEIEGGQVPEFFNRIVVSVDPATTTKVESDMTGIIVSARDNAGKGYVLEDQTGRYSPAEWAEKVVTLYEQYQADCIVAERNQGGDMVRHTIHSREPNVHVKLVHASRGKMARAEPISALYEQGKIFHVRGLNELEDQMVQWEPLGDLGSPDRLDALVWGLTELFPRAAQVPKIRVINSK